MSALAAPEHPEPPKKKIARPPEETPITVVWRRRKPAASKRPAPKLHERDDSV
jgi:hypothetical protein